MQRRPSGVDTEQSYLPSPDRCLGPGTAQAVPSTSLNTPKRQISRRSADRCSKPRESSSLDRSSVEHGSSSVHGGNSIWRGCHSGRAPCWSSPSTSPAPSPPPRGHIWLCTIRPGASPSRILQPRDRVARIVFPTDVPPNVDCRPARNTGIEVRGPGSGSCEEHRCPSVFHPTILPRSPPGLVSGVYRRDDLFSAPAGPQLHHMIAGSFPPSLLSFYQIVSALIQVFRHGVR